MLLTTFSERKVGGIFMKTLPEIDDFLKENPTFTTQDFLCFFKDVSLRDAYRTLDKLQKENRIQRISRGHYSLSSLKKNYHFELSDKAKQITALILSKFPLLSFQISEMLQWNEFLNHQIAHNTFFIDVEGDLGTYVFNLLSEKYPRVLLYPDISTYYRYYQDDMIVIGKLLSQSPSPIKGTHQTSLEKLLVDLFSSKLSGRLIEKAEYLEIFRDAFATYEINELSLFRYAKRRNLDKKIEKFLSQEEILRVRNTKKD